MNNPGTPGAAGAPGKPRVGSLEVRPAGDRGLLLELESNASVHVVAGAARERFGDALQEVVPGHVTLLLVWADEPPDEVALASDLMALVAARAVKSDIKATRGTTVSEPVLIPVVYDGPDLERVAETLGLSVAALTELHSGMVFTVAFMGFAPGFPYLIADKIGGDGSGDGIAKAAELLALPRLATPRTEVPAGSVAVAAGYCGIYPRSSPGGWNLLGRTDAVLFDAARELPALLEPGAQVRFAAQ